MPNFIYLLLPVLFWSGNYVLGRVTLTSGFDPFALSFLRWTLAGLFILPFAYKKLYQERQHIAQHWKLLTLFAWLGVCNYNLFLYIGLTSTSVTNAVLLNSIMPVMILISARIILQQTTTGLQNLGILISTLGAIEIVSRGSLDTLLQLTISTGDMWILAAAICWAVYSVLIVKRPQSLSTMGFFASTVAIGILIQIPLTLLFAQQDFSALTYLNWATVVYMAIFASIGAFLCWNTGIQKLGAATAGHFIHLMPVFSIILSVIFLDETFFDFHAIGMVLIFAGILIATVLNKRYVKRKQIKI